MAAEPSGQDVSHRIRNAIKSKLVDIGCYVDDELPDYVMVMIANKKTKEQMKADLELFLGDYCNSFCDWLHQVLEHLQRYAREGKHKLELFDAKLKKSGQLSDDEVDLHPNADEQRDFPDLDVKDELSKRRCESSTKKSRSPLRKIEERTKKRLKDRVEEVAKEVKRKDGDGKLSKSDRKRIEVVAESQKSPVKRSPNKQRRRSTSLDRASKKGHKKIKPRETNNNTNIRNRKTQEDPSCNKADLQKSILSQGTNEEPKKQRETSIRSQIVVKVARSSPETDEDGEEYDPSKPQLRSVAQIAPRKKRVVDWTSIGKNKLLAKALTDANRSTTQQTLPPPQEPQKRSIKDRLGAYVTETVAISVVQAQLHRMRELPPSLGDEEEEDENMKTKVDPGALDDLRMSLKRSIYVNKNVPNAHEKLAEVVNPKKRLQDEPAVASPIKLGPIEPPKSRQNDVECPELPTKLSFKKCPEPDNRCEPASECLTEPVDSNIIKRNGMIVKQSPLLQACGLTASIKRKIEAPESDDTDSKKQKPSNTGKEIPLKSLDDLIKTNAIGNTSLKSRMKCKFDPSCSNPGCLYIHPGQPCTNFPHCGFKASTCRYRHPPCFYDKICTNRACLFNHKSDGMPTAETAKPAPCKFFPNCVNLTCPFYHPPIPCKFGLRCQAPVCQYTHPEKSTVAKLKWVAQEH